LYDNSDWTAVGVPEFTVITNEQFAGDGSTVAFTLGSTQTTNSCIVSINGVVQIPITSYSVAGTDPTCVLTFTEAPAPGDAIEVRQITTTTSVTSISNAPGTAVISTNPTDGNIDITGNVVASGVFIGDGSGLTNLNVSGNSISFGTSNVAVRSTNGNVETAVDSITVQTISTGLVAVTGNISATGDIVGQNVNSLSDATLKTNVAPIENAGAVVDALDGVGYDWTDGSGHAYGLLAQMVELVVPEAVRTDENGIKSINYQMLTPFLIETIKELRRDVAELKARINK
jgi:hypothetical protein